MLRRIVLLVAAFPLVGIASSCKTPTEVEEETLQLTAEPSPVGVTALRGVTYTVKGDDTHPDEVREYDWKASFSVTAYDEKGLDGLKVTGVTVSLQPAAGGIVFNPRSDTVYYDYNIQASSNTIPKKGQASVNIEVWYDLPNAGREALVTVVMGFVDEDKLTYQKSVEVSVR
jgi:hypothetical protein